MFLVRPEFKVLCHCIVVGVAFGQFFPDTPQTKQTCLLQNHIQLKCTLNYISRMTCFLLDCSLRYLKKNDLLYGIKVAHRNVNVGFWFYRAHDHVKSRVCSSNGAKMKTGESTIISEGAIKNTKTNKRPTTVRRRQHTNNKHS